MHRIVIAVMSTISALVVLFNYHTSTNSTSATEPVDTTDTNPESTAGSTPNASASADPTPSQSESTSSGDSAGSSGVYTGDAVQTRWGTVQVQITVENGNLTAAEAVKYPNENPHDQQINSYAIPILNASATAAGSADIDAVSGATITSQGYITSLQSAIDAAHLK